MDIEHFLELLKLQEGISKTTCGSQVVSYHRGLSNKSPKPILVLIHGYPQSSYIWRHVIPLLPNDLPLFVPDIPGYGRSTASSSLHDKRTIGKAILEALRDQLGHQEEQQIIIAGHDRGARVCHRLAVDAASTSYSGLPIVGTILLDIVPTLTQFESFANSKTATGSFHWPFLANVDIATEMIMAQGGGRFCKYLIDRWAGGARKGLHSLKSNGSMEVYSKYFDNEAVVRATCKDYEAGAKEDVDEQRSDQKAGRKINCPTMVIYSADYLGSRFDLEAVWKQWISHTSLLQVEGISDAGHFVAEEAPEITASCFSQFLESVGK